MKLSKYFKSFWSVWDICSTSIMSNFIQLTFNPLDVNVILHKLKSPTTGAISVFIGTTRDTFDGQRVKRLEYEAYQTMAVKKITQVCENLRQQWDVFNIAIYHRLGEVEPEEASVVIAITSKHRKDALSAVQVTFKWNPFIDFFRLFIFLTFHSQRKLSTPWNLLFQFGRRKYTKTDLNGNQTMSVLGAKGNNIQINR